MKRIFTLVIIINALLFGQFSWESGNIATLAAENYWVYPCAAKSINGTPFTMFRMTSNNNVVIKKWTGSGFTDVTSFTTATAGANSFMDYQSFAIDKDTNIHVVIRGIKNVSGTNRQGMFYGLFNGTTWSFEFFHNIDVTINANSYSSRPIIGVDNTNKPHIVYYVTNGSAANATMKYAVKNGTWSITDVVTLSTTAGDEFDFYDMVTLPNGNVHLIFSDEYNNDYKFDLKYYVYNGTSWSSENIQTGIYMGYNAQLAVNSAGKAFVFYSQFNSDVSQIWLKTANNVSGWQVETFASNAGVTDYNIYDLLINPNDDLCFVYEELDRNTYIQTPLHFIIKEGASWTNYTSTSDIYPWMYESCMLMDNNKKVFVFHANDLGERPHLINYYFGTYTNPLPVELQSFQAVPSGNEIKLTWKTSTEVKNHGFEVERISHNSSITGNENWINIGFVAGNGTSNSVKEYSFIDRSPLTGSALYRLKQIDVDGTVKYHAPVEVSLNTPTQFTLLQNSPNPFNPTTSIRFNLPVASQVTLKVYDVMGSEVATLVNSLTEAGAHLVTWNGKDNYGIQAASGVYIYKLTAGDYTETRKMNLIK